MQQNMMHQQQLKGNDIADTFFFFETRTLVD